MSSFQISKRQSRWLLDYVQMSFSFSLWQFQNLASKVSDLIWGGMPTLNLPFTKISIFPFSNSEVEPWIFPSIQLENKLKITLDRANTLYFATDSTVFSCRTISLFPFFNKNERLRPIVTSSSFCFRVSLSIRHVSRGARIKVHLVNITSYWLSVDFWST